MSLPNQTPKGQITGSITKPSGLRSSTVGQVNGTGQSIDPKLFAPKSKETSLEVQIGQKRDQGQLEGNEDGVEEEEEVKKEIKGGKKKKDEKKKVSHARKSPAHIPRPRNAFILFRKHVVDSKLIPASVEMRHQNVSIITAKMWAEAPAEQKAHFNELARIEKEEHMIKYPGYRYQPVYRRTNVIRRRVRKDQAEEDKCKSVAELLLRGKTGKALEEEIRERKVLDEESEVSEKKDKSSRRGSASELSKGALRALRAQARQRTASVDWSETSASVGFSRQVSPGGDDSYAQEGWNEHGNGQGQEQFYAPPAEFGWFSEGMQQSYAYPQENEHTFDPQPQPHYSYPQPVAPFYPGESRMRYPSIPDISFSVAPDLLSPTDPTPLAATSRTLRPPSARWDRSFGQELEGLFDSNDMLLEDFGAALAQAEEGVTGW
ncbi:hypothetical protein TREMEDRAFT_63576 [Tremella mesenterica DSM 1558]|uniref:uncharacterized protein n=1 Tax=Tremella mesenterica (strain ATCC 24925 / CBS 8224 / DSM 1558 / NBRC 9311 / NRRL Y-6157 / RJB 2259-6 / UBC 559-6) TaxID=578456 RepID=UPI0003F4924C|nr:uncharacterized protein TREMEDRAFT_63576 [Tremella mesenterica DSM 1558]EIW68407.1 hypothetical protein TREMEDRAFT_63576 [Tremella mesenterica DSM 1558]